MEYYKRIRNVREDKDLKQYEIARELGINPKMYNFYETGRRAIPLDVMDKIVTRLKISFDYAFELDGNFNHTYTKADLSQVGKNIRAERKKLGLSQTVFASKIGCNQQSLSQYERGKLTVPVEVLQKICQEFKISADVILGRKK